MSDSALTPFKAAFRLTKLLNEFSNVHGGQRFPVDVESLAKHCHEVFHWSDPIAKVHGADIPGFDGCLTTLGSGKGWAIVYNSALPSEGRIRFTLAHELGHYVVHRTLKTEFMCTGNDMDDWQAADRNIETEADLFAANLLMPLDDFKTRIENDDPFRKIAECAEVYGVSLTAAALRWISATERKALLVASNDGFIRWASSSDTARQAGAFFRTRGRTNELPSRSLAADANVLRELDGVSLPANVWFPKAHADTKLREMKIVSEQYGTLSLLILPSTADVWGPWNAEN
ncbi:ImmA/IrrE family metallo-endopeptidase [Paraburkholderia aspalathi]|uniref:ImmA/IrrE family metallo-endopeptidase n=1 Tax=Paraburkholderia aspalathi TaxID=1324617 RepID=UPI003C9F2605